jgi:hypothetical protein
MQCKMLATWTESITLTVREQNSEISMVSLTPSLTYSLTHSLAHSHLLYNPFTHSLTPSLTHSHSHITLAAMHLRYHHLPLACRMRINGILFSLSYELQASSRPPFFLRSVQISTVIAREVTVNFLNFGQAEVST